MARITEMNKAEILKAFRELRVLVVGDVCLDRWCSYDPKLADTSRETGIPRIAVVKTELTPGAAGTVASNVAALGARVSVMGAIGADGFGFELSGALDRRGIGHDLLIHSNAMTTFTYTKLLRSDTGVEDLPRVDFINTAPLPAELDGQLVRRLENAARGFDVILVSDQAETGQGGVVSAAMRQALERIATAERDKIVWVDSRMRPELFRRVVVKPNHDEAEAASMRALGRLDYPALRSHMEAPLLIVTHGGDGAELIDPYGTTWVATRREENPVDVCGAGDSFSAGAALALKVTGDAHQAVRFGNLVASITIMKKGTGTASPEEVLGYSPA
jgi:rfaE bifunctional protein kinase chain/domain